MIASSLLAAALASTSPAQAAPAPAPAHDHSAMVGDKGTGGAMKMVEGKMDCCKDGCACCAKKDAAKTTEAAPAH